MISLHDELFSIERGKGQYSIDGVVEVLEPMVPGTWRARCTIVNFTTENRKYQYLQVTFLFLDTIPEDRVMNMIRRELMVKCMDHPCDICIGTRNHFIEMSLNESDHLFIHRDEDKNVDMLGVLHYKNDRSITGFRIIKDHEACIFTNNQ